MDGVVINNKPCNQFWEQSKKGGPDAAIRKAARELSDEVAAELGLWPKSMGGEYSIKSISNLCTNPSPNAKEDHKERKRIRTTITIKPKELPGIQSGFFLRRLSEKILAGQLQKLAIEYGAGKWAPKPFTYKSGYWPICVPEYTLCTKVWRPGDIKLVQ